MGSSDLCYLYFNFLLTSSHIARLLLKALYNQIYANIHQLTHAF